MGNLFSYARLGDNQSNTVLVHLQEAPNVRSQEGRGHDAALGRDSGAVHAATGCLQSQRNQRQHRERLCLIKESRRGHALLTADIWSFLYADKGRDRGAAFMGRDAGAHYAELS